MDPEGILLSEISQTEEDKYCKVSLIRESFKKTKQAHSTENRLVDAKGGGWGMSKMGKGSQKVQTSSYKINMSWRC